MSKIAKSYDINKTFVIKPLLVTGETTTLTACTGIYTNAISSCSGDTQIFLGNGIITFDGNLYTNDELSANTVNASTYLSGGTNIFDVISFNNISGGTFDNTSDTLTLFKQNNTTIIVTGFTDYYTTGSTLIGDTVYFDRNDTLSAYTLSLSAFSTVDVYVTGATFNNNQLIITRNDNVNINTFIDNFTGLTINGILSANTVNSDNYFSGGTNLSTIINDVNLTGGTFNSNLGVLSLNKTNGSIQITGFTDFYITGVTYDNNNVLTFTNNNGQSLSVLFNVFSGLTVNGLISSDTISATTYQNLPTSLDVFVTGGTYNNGTTVFTNNTGGTFNVSGFVTGDTYWVSGSTGVLSIKTNNNSGLDALGDYALAEGFNTLAGGDNSHAGGFNSISSGNTSFIHSSKSIVLGDRSVVLGGQNLTGLTDDTVFVPRINVKYLSGGTTLNSVGIDSDGFLVNDNEFDFSLNFINTVSYPIILPYNWRVNSVDNISGITYTITNNLLPYTLGTNISAFTDTISVSAATNGFINLKCVKIN